MVASSVQTFILGTPVVSEPSSVQQFIRATPILPTSSSTQQFVRATPLLPVSSATTGFILGDPVPNVGIRGPQVEPFDVELNRLTHITSNLLATISVDLTATGDTILISATQKIYVTGIVIRVTDDDTVTAPAEAEITVAPAIGVFANQTLIDLNQVGDIYTFWNNLNTGAVVYSGEDLVLSVNAAATAISLQATVYVIGFYLPGGGTR